MTETDSAGLKRTSGNRWGLTAAVLGIAVILGLFGACASFAPLSSDEPPIRVRGGTMHLDLLTEGGEDFEQDDPNDKKTWHIKGSGSRDRNDFLVVVVSASANCNGKVASANKVDVVYSGGQNVEFKSNNNNTKITALKDLEYQAPKWLKYETQDGYVSAVKVDNNNLCTFDAKDATLQIFLLD